MKKSPGIFGGCVQVLRFPGNARANYRASLPYLSINGVKGQSSEYPMLLSITRHDNLFRNNKGFKFYSTSRRCTILHNE